jgi:hypothetical protein
LHVENRFGCCCWIEGATSRDFSEYNWHLRHVHGRLLKSLPVCGRAILVTAMANGATADHGNGSAGRAIVNNRGVESAPNRSAEEPQDLLHLIGCRARKAVTLATSKSYLSKIQKNTLTANSTISQQRVPKPFCTSAQDVFRKALRLQGMCPLPQHLSLPTLCLTFRRILTKLPYPGQCALNGVPRRCRRK